MVKPGCRDNWVGFYLVVRAFLRTFAADYSNSEINRYEICQLERERLACLRGQGLQ